MNIINVIIITVLVTSIIYIIPLEKEGFSPKEYNIAHSTRILDDKPFSNKELNNDTYNDLYMLKPKTKIGSYKQITNNNEQYMTPCIGNSIRANFCKSMYSDYTVKTTRPEKKFKYPVNICQRVNMHCVS